MFSAICGALMLLALGLLAYAGYQMALALMEGPEGLGDRLLSAVGYSVISLAVFEVAKYLLEEEILHPSELRYPSEARRGLTKFITTIAIAIFLEALVMVFAAGKEDLSAILYPTLLLMAGVALIVGLGVYQRLSVDAERLIGGIKGEAEAEAEAQARAEDKNDLA